MKYQLHGIAPVESKVEVVGADGRTVARTVAGIDGNWNIDGVDLCAGEHDLQAICTDDNGHRVCSRLLCVDVEAEDTDDGETDGPDRVDMLANIVQQQRANAAYTQIVKAYAAGLYIDIPEIREACELSGREVGDFITDVEAVRELAAEDVGL